MASPVQMIDRELFGRRIWAVLPIAVVGTALSVVEMALALLTKAAAALAALPYAAATRLYAAIGIEVHMPPIHATRRCCVRCGGRPTFCGWHAKNVPPEAMSLPGDFRHDVPSRRGPPN